MQLHLIQLWLCFCVCVLHVHSCCSFAFPVSDIQIQASSTDLAVEEGVVLRKEQTNNDRISYLCGVTKELDSGSGSFLSGPIDPIHRSIDVPLLELHSSP